MHTKEELETGKAKLFAELSAASGVSAEEVAKVMAALGIDNHFDLAARSLGATPSMKEVLLGYHVNGNAVMV